MANYKLDSIDINAGRSELHNALALTGCEVSCNNLSAGKNRLGDVQTSEPSAMELQSHLTHIDILGINR